MAPAAPRAINVKVDGSYNPALTAVLARVGQPVTITLDAQSAADIIRSRCGTLDPTYLAEFMRENAARGPFEPASLERPSPGKVYSFPYCLPPRTKKTTQAPIIGKVFADLHQPLDARGLHQSFLSRANDMLHRSISTLRLFSSPGDSGSDKGFVATENALRFRRENPNFDPAKNPTVATFSVDAGPRTETVPIRATESVDTARSQLAAARSPVTNAAPATGDVVTASLIGEMTLRDGECQDTGDQDHWPIDTADLASAIAENARLRSPDLDPKPARVMLIDTGYDTGMGVPAFGSSAFIKLHDAQGLSQPIYVGINTSGTPSFEATPPQTLPSWAHGGQVAATIRGSRFIPAQVQSTLPQLSFASIVAKPGAGPPYLDVGGIARAYTLAVKNQITIINASVAATTPREEFLELIAKNDAVLLVTAAGNVDSTNPAFTTDSQSWPGSMGGNPANAGIALVISVGAHDPHGLALYFSRQDPDVVDVLAPGCKIPTYTFNGATRKVEQLEANGTSFAAPLVTLVASLLSFEGLTPRMIKDRILLSASVDERVAEASWSGGRLNVRRALSVYRDTVDYVEESSPGVLTRKHASGRLLSGPKIATICGTTLNQSQLKKLAFSPSDPSNLSSDGTWRGWSSTLNPTPTTAIHKLNACKRDVLPTGDPIILWNADTGGNITIPLANVRDFVAATFPRDAPPTQVAMNRQ